MFLFIHPICTVHLLPNYVNYLNINAMATFQERGKKGVGLKTLYEVYELPESVLLVRME